MSKPILCLDFDGVCHSYTSGWKGADVIPDAPVDGLVDAIIDYRDKFEVHIFSSRSLLPGGMDAMKQYVKDAIMKYYDCSFAGNPKDFDKALELYDCIVWDTQKPSAFITIDDRVYLFKGKFPKAKELLDFKPWNKK